MKTQPCYRCGFCCKVSPCGYAFFFMAQEGKDPGTSVCPYLSPRNTCTKHNEIIEREKSYKTLLPMMGSGCSSPLCNTMRDAKMRELRLNPENEQKEIFASIPLDFSPDFAKLWGKIKEDK